MSSIWTVRRSATDRKVSGLSAGLAHTWNVDPMLVRVGFAVLALSGGIGLVLYAAGWLMLPLEGRTESQLEEWIPQTRTWSREVKVGVVVVACIIGAIALSWLVPFSFAAALVVAAFWYFGYYRTHRQRPEQHDQQTPQLQFAEFPGEPTAFTEAARAWQQRIAEYQQTRASEHAFAPAPPTGRPVTSPAAPTGASPDRWATTDQPADPHYEAFLAHPDPVGLYTEPATADSAVAQLAKQKQLRRRSARRLGLVSVIALGLTMTGLGIASVAGAPITAAVYLSAALLIFGITLLAGARFGRPRGLAFATVVVAVSMIMTLLAQNNTSFARDIGIKHLHYATVAELPQRDHLRVGQLTVDLRDLRPDQARTYTASVDDGRLVVELPRGVAMKVNATVEDGMIKTTGQQPRSGSELSLTEPPPAGAGGPVFTVNLHVGNGPLEVRR